MMREGDTDSREQTSDERSTLASANGRFVDGMLEDDIFITQSTRDVRVWLMLDEQNVCSMSRMYVCVWESRYRSRPMEWFVSLAGSLSVDCRSSNASFAVVESRIGSFRLMDSCDGAE